MIDCNEWRTEKRHECANMGKVKRLELWWQVYGTSLPVWDLENFRPMDFFWHECTVVMVWLRRQRWYWCETEPVVVCCGFVVIGKCCGKVHYCGVGRHQTWPFCFSVFASGNSFCSLPVSLLNAVGTVASHGVVICCLLKHAHSASAISTIRQVC